jgi:hypothetical protein
VANKGYVDSLSMTAGNVIAPADPGEDDYVLVASGGLWDWVDVRTRNETVSGSRTHTGAVTLLSVDAGAAAAPVLSLYRNSLSPAAADLLAQISFLGEDDASNVLGYAFVRAVIDDPANGSEDGHLSLGSVVAGVLDDSFHVGAGLYADGATGGDKGADTVNASAYYANGEGPIGKVLQVVQTVTGAVSTGTTTVPVDNSIPQKTEGDEYMSLAITPKSSSSRLRIDIVVNLAMSAANHNVVAFLLRDSGAGALAAVYDFEVAADAHHNLAFSHDMASPGTSSTTFKVRAGASGAGTTTFNGKLGGRIFGGVMASSIIITEYLT